MDTASVFPLKLYLNLTRREDRRLRLEWLLENLQWSAERVSAADARYVRNLRGYPTAPRYACALSHRIALRKARMRRTDAVLILEDDVVLHPQIVSRLEEIELPEDWGIFYLGCQHLERPQPIAHNLVRVRYAYDTHAYAVRAKWLPEVAKILDARHAGLPWNREAGEYACDVLLARLHETIPTYAAWPNLAWQMQDMSDVANAVYANYTKDGCQKANAHLTKTLGVEWAVKNSAQYYNVEHDGVLQAIERGSPLRLNLGCGPIRLEGEAHLPASQFAVGEALPFADGSVGLLRWDPGIEHVAPNIIWGFFEEVYRVLCPNGIMLLSLEDWEQGWVRLKHGSRRSEDGNIKAALKALVCAEERHGVWTAGLMRAILEAIGFHVTPHTVGEPTLAHQSNWEQPRRSMEEELNEAARCSIEARKS